MAILSTFFPLALTIAREIYAKKLILFGSSKYTDKEGFLVKEIVWKP